MSAPLGLENLYIGKLNVPNNFGKTSLHKSVKPLN